MPDILADLAPNVIAALGLEPEYPDGDPNEVLIKVTTQLWVLWTVVKSYTRGNGFSVDENGVEQVDEPLQAVMVMAYPRIALTYVTGTAGSGEGLKYLSDWSDTELKILNSYRLIAG